MTQGKGSDSLVERRWSLGGYAPGGYMCKCHSCSAGFAGDKRAVTCLPCAAEQAASTIEALTAERDEREATRAARRKTIVLLAGIPEPWKSTIVDLDAERKAAEALALKYQEHLKVAVEALEAQRLLTAPVMKSLMATSWRDDLLLADRVHKADAALRSVLTAVRGEEEGNSSSCTDSADARFSETARAAQRKSEGGGA